MKADRRLANLFKTAISLVLLIVTSACQANLHSTITPNGSASVVTTSLGTIVTSTPKADTPTPNPVSVGQISETSSAPGASVPPVWDLFSDDFEKGISPAWGKITGANLQVINGKGIDGSRGLSVTLPKLESYLYRNDLPENKEGYLTFWFNPDQIIIPGGSDLPLQVRSIRIADVKGSANFSVIAAIRIWQPDGASGGYKGTLEWQNPDGYQYGFGKGQFDIVTGWQKITLGYSINHWVAVWVNDSLVMQINDLTHIDPFAGIIEVGKANDDSNLSPEGAMLFDHVVFQLPKYSDLWVDSVSGADQNSGLDEKHAFRKIQTASDLAGPGTRIHILPGTYRETIRPAFSGTSTEPVQITAENGAGSVHILGSLPSNTLTWRQLTSNSIGLPLGVDATMLYYADLSDWGLADSPRFVVMTDEKGTESRLPLAREPDWTVQTEWKTAEYWWSADGGYAKSSCDPTTNPNPNCDESTRSMYQLTDATNDTEPQDIEPGDLSSLGDLTGATLVALDTLQGHYVYRRLITSHEVAAGKITVDRKCEHDDGSGIPGLGWGTKYYVENKASLLDEPGEWWYDRKTGHFYIWPPSATNPANLHIEISREQTGIDLSDRSNIVLDGIAFENFNGSAIYGNNDRNEKSENNVIRNTILKNADDGILLFQEVGENPENITHSFKVEKSDIGYMDSNGLNLAYAWKNGSAPASFTVAGISDTTIQDNVFHHLGFRSDHDNAIGISIEHADRLRFENNRVQQVAHNGLQFSWSLIQSNKSNGFSPDEIKIGGILVKDNIFEQACELTTDCGGLKFWGDPPYGHVYRDVLITGNIFRNNLGWSSVSEKRRRWSGGPGSNVQGMGGFGLYLDMASGFNVFRNIAFHNGYAGYSVGGVWRDSEMVFSNNVAANSLMGFNFRGIDFDTHGNLDTQIVNNIIINNEAFGVSFADSGQFSKGLQIDHNLYSNNGWLYYARGGMDYPGDMLLQRSEDLSLPLRSVSEIQTATSWEPHGLDGDPFFWNYDLKDHSLLSTSWPDFHLTVHSTDAIDRGTSVLPDSLVRLLVKYNISSEKKGTAFDMGAYEFK